MNCPECGADTSIGEPHGFSCSQEAGTFYRTMMETDGTELVIVMERNHIEPGTSFSTEAIDLITRQLAVWVGTRILLRWRATGEPPTVARVTIRVEAQ